MKKILFEYFENKEQGLPDAELILTDRLKTLGMEEHKIHETVQEMSYDWESVQQYGQDARDGLKRFQKKAALLALLAIAILVAVFNGWLNGKGIPLLTFIAAAILIYGGSQDLAKTRKYKKRKKRLSLKWDNWAV